MAAIVTPPKRSRERDAPDAPQRVLRRRVEDRLPIALNFIVTQTVVLRTPGLVGTVMGFLSYRAHAQVQRVSRAWRDAGLLRHSLPTRGSLMVPLYHPRRIAEPAAPAPEPYVIDFTYEEFLEPILPDIDRFTASRNAREANNHWSAYPRRVRDDDPVDGTADRWMLPGRPIRKYAHVLQLYLTGVRFCVRFQLPEQTAGNVTVEIEHGQVRTVLSSVQMRATCRDWKPVLDYHLWENSTTGTAAPWTHDMSTFFLVAHLFDTGRYEPFDEVLERDSKDDATRTVSQDHKEWWLRTDGPRSRLPLIGEMLLGIRLPEDFSFAWGEGVPLAKRSYPRLQTWSQLLHAMRQQLTPLPLLQYEHPGRIKWFCKHTMRRFNQFAFQRLDAYSENSMTMFKPHPVWPVPTCSRCDWEASAHDVAGIAERHGARAP